MAALDVKTARTSYASGNQGVGILDTLVSGDGSAQTVIQAAVSAKQLHLVKGRIYSDGNTGAETLLLQSNDTTICTIFLPASENEQALPPGIFTTAGEALKCTKSAANQTISMPLQYVPVSDGLPVPQLG